MSSRIPLSFIYSLPTPPKGSSLGDLLAHTVTDNGRVQTLLDCIPTTDSPAIFAPDASRSFLSHRALHAFISSFALPYTPSRRPLGPNDRVMVILPTSPENATALLALAAYHTTAPVNASCTASELREDAERLGARAIFATREAEERLEFRQLQQELDVEVVYMEPRAGQVGLFDMSLLDESDESTLGGHEAAGKPSQLHNLSDFSLVLHTSGTSGKKKVVPYSLRHLIVGTTAVIVSWDLHETDVNMNMMPLFHVGGIVRNLLAPIMSGGSAIMCSGFDATSFWPLAMEIGATWYYAAPTMHHAILASRPDAVLPSRDTRIRMICNAAGGLLPTLAVELKETFGGAIVLPSYGMTECMPISTPPTNYQLDRPGCSGIACGPYMSIRNPANLEQELPIGQTGAVCVRGLPTFDGYETTIGAPLDTSAFSSEGWFDSGDCGSMDTDGYLFITGRSKEIINKGGEVISPFEIEEAIMTVAKERVKTTLAFSVEHDVLQESIGVVIVPVSAQPRISLGELHDLLREVLHPSKWPFAVVYMDDLPKNAAGKPLRIKLAQRLGLGQLTDNVPALQRHFEAEVPDKNASLSDPIECSRVSTDAYSVERALLGIMGVEEVAIRTQSDGSLEAFVSAVSSTDLNVAQIRDTLAQVVAGYSIPDPLHIVRHKFPRVADGSVDFANMNAEIAAANASSLSRTGRIVRDIFAQLLFKEAGTITGEADFFLLGGNSLLLGRLAYFIKKETGQVVKVPDLFTNSTVAGIARLIDSEAATMSVDTLHEEKIKKAFRESTLDSLDELPTLGYSDSESKQQESVSRGQTHPISLLVQIIPITFMYPMKAALTWAMILFILAKMIRFADSFWSQMGILFLAIITARLTSRVVAPLGAIAFKWLVIGKYQPGVYKMWSPYHMRWWIVNQAIRAAGRGVFSMTPGLERSYARLLGANIGRDVHIDKSALLGEYDLLTIEDGARIDKALVRGFCIERDGYFRLERIHIGRRAVVNTYTQIAPGAVIADGKVYGPHASSHEDPSPKFFGNYNRTLKIEPHWALKVFIAWPIILLVNFASFIPWIAMIYLMIKDARFQPNDHWNALEVVIQWFSAPRRVLFHALARIVRAVAAPLVKVALGIVVKRIFGLNREGLASNVSQMTLLRRYINGSLLSQESLKRAFDILGTHYEATSFVFRLMGAKIGKRVYWPGSGVYCPDPELLEVGDDVVFGSRSELFTTDRVGTQRIVIGPGAMIADRVVLLPGTRVGRKTVMGSGALGRREGNYADGSTWMGSENGEAICFSKGKSADELAETLTPFGLAFYKRQASFFVFPYFFLVIINILVASLSAAYWSISAVAAAQLLRQIKLHLDYRHMFAETWYNLAVLYGLIATCFVLVLNAQAWLAMGWVILTKWLVIGRRRPGPCEWDKSSYCQRWQLHLTLSRPLYRGYGNGGVLAPITGSVYIVWFYRALGAKIGKNVSIFASGKAGLMTEPDLVSLGDWTSLDNCSVVAHINSRGKFALNALKIGQGCALRSGSRLLSGAEMEDSSMLLEHTLLTSGETAEAGSVYVGWPARQLDDKEWRNGKVLSDENDFSKEAPEGARFICPKCQGAPQAPVVTACGHLFCGSCINQSLASRKVCPVCYVTASPKDLRKIYPSFVV